MSKEFNPITAEDLMAMDFEVHGPVTVKFSPKEIAMLQALLQGVADHVKHQYDESSKRVFSESMGLLGTVEKAIAAGNRRRK